LARLTIAIGMLGFSIVGNLIAPQTLRPYNIADR
jgi:hypothetical protein